MISIEQWHDSIILMGLMKFYGAGIKFVVIYYFFYALSIRFLELVYFDMEASLSEHFRKSILYIPKLNIIH